MDVVKKYSYPKELTIDSRDVDPQIAMAEAYAQAIGASSGGLEPDIISPPPPEDPLTEATVGVTPADTPEADTGGSETGDTQTTVLTKPTIQMQTGTATRYKTCWSGCPEPLGVSVAMSDTQRDTACPTSHPFSVKPSCGSGTGTLLDGASTRPTGGGGGGGGFGGIGLGGESKPGKPVKRKKDWIPVILMVAGAVVLFGNKKN